MNKFRDRILSLGKKSKARILLPEIEDRRVITASEKLRSLGFNIINYQDFKNHEKKYFDYINTLSFTSNWPSERLREYLSNPLYFGLAMIACGDADCLVSGAITSSSDVIRAAIRMIGIQPQSNNISSTFFMISPEGEKAFTFSDCAVIPEPDYKQLVEIASDSAYIHQLLSGEVPKVAFLSFSTKGSAEHYRVDKVRDAVELFNKKYPEIINDGEIQIDAAIIPEVSKKKTPASPLEGSANVLIFPNLDAANIAYKLTERLAGYSAWGPLLQGLKKPIHDLSRGCSYDDIINTAAIAAMQSNIYANV